MDWEAAAKTLEKRGAAESRSLSLGERRVDVGRAGQAARCTGLFRGSVGLRTGNCVAGWPTNIFNEKRDQGSLSMSESDPTTQPSARVALFRD